MASNSVHITNTAAQWEAAKARYVCADFAIMARHESASEDDLDQLAEELSEAWDEICSIPAPSRAALLWRLNKLLEAEDGGTTQLWSAEAVRQSLADLDAALADDPKQSAWDSAVAEVQRCEALDIAASTFGPYAKAEEDIAVLRIRCAPTEEITAAEQSAALHEAAYIEAYAKPLWEAYRRLALTHAPDAAALHYKVELIKSQDLHLDPNMPDNLFGMIEAEIRDLARLPN